MAEKKTTETPSFLEDVPTRFEGGQSVIGVPLPKVVTEPFKGRPEVPAPDFLEDARPTTGSRIKAAGLGTIKGALRDPPMLAGAMAGFRVGMPLAAVAAPFLGPGSRPQA